MSARVRRKVRSALALLATAIIGGAVHADAPPGQYASFDRWTMHCITDQWTKLIWTRTQSTVKLTFGDAATGCAGVAHDAGEPPWRVPSVNELETLVDEIPHYEIENGQSLPKAIDANAFHGTPTGTRYWTSSVVPGVQGGVSYAWVVNFGDGSTAKVPMTESYLVKCVTEVSAKSPAACL